jgi:hypothetical protein
MKTHNVEQRSDEWFAIRAKCLMTASNAGAFLTKSDATSVKARRGIIAKRLASRIYGNDELPGHSHLEALKVREVTSMLYNPAVQRGIELEPYACAQFESVSGFEVSPMGIITDDEGDFGASPDGLIYRNGVLRYGLEIKCPIPETHIKWLDDGILPDEHKHQVNTSIAIVGVPWYFMSYCPGLPHLIRLVTRSKLTDQITEGMQILKNEYTTLGRKLAKLSQ